MPAYRTDLWPYAESPRNELFRTLIADDPIKTVRVRPDDEFRFVLARQMVRDAFACVVVTAIIIGVVCVAQVLS